MPELSKEQAEVAAENAYNSMNDSDQKRVRFFENETADIDFVGAVELVLKYGDGKTLADYKQEATEVGQACSIDDPDCVSCSG